MTMFGNPKPAASLSPGLLARKGQARPAMRSPGYGGFVAPGQAPDDLGWNDMGDGAAGIAHDGDAAAPHDPGASARDGIVPPPTGPIPAVLVEREALMAQIEAPAAVTSVSVATATRLQREARQGSKAALTLRVEADRHLRLRLAVAITNRSAQDLITQALDALIASLPEVAALVEQLPPAKVHRQRPSAAK